ncbi:hypothetical protein FRB99_003699 [Tulasnella sp. 403]|nr:hypothetical protein FRB99_003699 [Tulasnella sp. 403]
MSSTLHIGLTDLLTLVLKGSIGYICGSLFQNDATDADVASDTSNYVQLVPVPAGNIPGGRLAMWSYTPPTQVGGPGQLNARWENVDGSIADKFVLVFSTQSDGPLLYVVSDYDSPAVTALMNMEGVTQVVPVYIQLVEEGDAP